MMNTERKRISGKKEPQGFQLQSRLLDPRSVKVEVCQSKEEED